MRKSKFLLMTCERDRPNEREEKKEVVANGGRTVRVRTIYNL